MKTRRERLLAVLLMVLCVYALTLSKSISEAITTMLFDSNSEEIVIAASSKPKSTSTTSPKPTSTTTPSTSPKVSSKPSHTCSEAVGPYAGWYANSSKHWTECKTCEKTMRSASHSKSSASATSCRVCGYSMPSSTTSPKPTSTTTPSTSPKVSSKPSHTCSEAVGPYAGWYANSSKHWTECKTCGKTMRSASHSKSSASATSCRYCGYKMTSSSQTPGTHVHEVKYGPVSNNGWFIIPSGHYMQCTGCSAKLRYVDQNYLDSGIIEGMNDHVLNKNTGKCIYCYYSMKDTGTSTGSEKTYTITTKSDASEGIVTASQSIAKAGETITITATASVGYKFSSWKYSKAVDKKAATTTFVMPKCNVTISANFIKDTGTSTDSEKTYKISTASNKYWEVKASKSTAKAGETITIEAIAKSSQYQFSSWSYSGVADKKSTTTTFVMPSKNVSISARFIKSSNTAKTYTISIEQVNGGKVTASRKIAKAGETITITATAYAGYSFSQWAGDVEVKDKKSTKTTFVMPSSNVKIWASFVGKNTDSNSDGILDHEHSMYSPRKNFTVYMRAFDDETDWYPCLAGSGCTYRINEEAHNLNYKYKDENSHKITCSKCAWSKTEQHDTTNGQCACGIKPRHYVDTGVSQPTPYGDKYSVTSSGSWDVGSKVTLTTSGYTYFGVVEFVGWEVSGVSVSNTSSKTITFTMPDNDVTAVARWEYKKQPVKYNITLTTNKSKFDDQQTEKAEGKTVSIKLPGTSYDKIDSVEVTGVSYKLYGKQLIFTMPSNDVTIKVNYK